MTCEQARELAALAASGDVNAAERRALEMHNAGCVECRAEAEGFDELLAQLGVMREEALPESAGAAVRARVLAEIPTHHRPGWFAAWPAFAAAVACSALVVVLLRPEAPVKRPALKMPSSAPAQMVAATPVPAIAPTKRHSMHRAAPKAPTEPVVVHMFTSDPDVVIYWIADTNRKSSTSGAM